MTARAVCTFCTRESRYGPFGQVHVCATCARRIAALVLDEAALSRTRIWAAVEDAPEDASTRHLVDEVRRGTRRILSADDAASRLHLAEAYREMRLFADAAREAAASLRAGAGDGGDALGILLTPPVLRDGGEVELRIALSAP